MTVDRNAEIWLLVSRTVKSPRIVFYCGFATGCRTHDTPWLKSKRIVNSRTISQSIAFFGTIPWAPIPTQGSMLKIGYGKEKLALDTFNSLKTIAKGIENTILYRHNLHVGIKGFLLCNPRGAKEPLCNLWTRSQEKQQVHCNGGKDGTQLQWKKKMEGEGIFKCCGELVLQNVSGKWSVYLATCVCNWCLSKLGSYSPLLQRKILSLSFISVYYTTPWKR